MKRHDKPSAATIVLAASLALAGCASPLPIIQRDATPNPSSAYIAALFSGKGQGFGLGLTNTASGSRYLMPFFTYGSYFDAMVIFQVPEHKEAVNVIEVPSGTYRITHWAAYDPSNKEQFFEKKIDLSDSSSTFEAKAGRTVFIGRFKATQEAVVYKKIEFRILPLRASEMEFRELFQAAYPKFDSTRIDFWPPSVSSLGWY